MSFQDMRFYGRLSRHDVPGYFPLSLRDKGRCDWEKTSGKTSKPAADGFGFHRWYSIENSEEPNFFRILKNKPETPRVVSCFLTDCYRNLLPILLFNLYRKPLRIKFAPGLDMLFYASKLDEHSMAAGIPDGFDYERA